MNFDLKSFKDGLGVALDTFDWPQVDRHVNELIEGGLEHSDADPKNILQQLRRKRRFKTMQRLAVAWRSVGRTDSVITRQLAQALLEQGDQGLLDAIAELDGLRRQIAASSKPDDEEDAEARGLMGRCYKQLYVNGLADSATLSGLVLIWIHRN